MQTTLHGVTIELVQGDITDQDVEAIVNAANGGLAGGGGVDGAIHRAAGPEVMAACRKIGGCSTGSAVITTGGNLTARFVIHAVAPIYNNGVAGEAELLVGAYRRSLELAVEQGIASIAFPSLGTGAYRYPVTLAAPLALGTVVDFARSQAGSLKLVRFVLFDGKTLTAYENALQKLAAAEEKL